MAASILTLGLGSFGSPSRILTLGLYGAAGSIIASHEVSGFIRTSFSVEGSIRTAFSRSGKTRPIITIEGKIQ